MQDETIKLLVTKKQIGDWGEEKASVFLKDKGYEIIERKYRKRGGEVDIIARHDEFNFKNTICFVEVKTRSNEDGSAERATNKEKFAHWFLAARHYCLEKGIDMETTPIQFEQISIYIKLSEGDYRLYHYIVSVD